MKTILSTVLTCLVALASSAAADTPPTGISTPGVASIEVSPDQFEINFELLTEADSLSDAAAIAREMATKLQGLSISNPSVSFTVQYDLTFMRVKKWGKGHKLEYTFIMTVDNVPDGETETVLVDIAEAALALDRELTVQSYESLLSRDKEISVRAEVLRDAVADALSNATVIASAANVKLGAPRRIAVASSDTELGGRSFEYFSAGAGVVSFNRARKPFVVHSDLASRIRISVALLVEFETNPT